MGEVCDAGEFHGLIIFIESFFPIMPPTEKYVNPLTDFGFKKLFGEEPNKDILISLLNEILPRRHTIEDLTYAKNERLGAGEIDRKAIFDLYCTATSGERFIVELQKAKQNYFKDRSVYYASFPIQEQARRGEWNFRLEAVYTVGILDFIFADHKDQDELYHLVELKDQQNRVFYDKLKFIYIELPKFTKQADELSSNFEKWLYVFRHLSSLNDRPPALQDRIFKKLFTVARISNFTAEERDAYESSLKYYRDIKNVVDTSREEGRAEGREEGSKRAIELIAKRMLAEGMDRESVRDITGLTEDDLRALS
jgi:predicted transposase/invertase (TIGR01784 family)